MHVSVARLTENPATVALERAKKVAGDIQDEHERNLRNSFPSDLLQCSLQEFAQAAQRLPVHWPFHKVSLRKCVELLDRMDDLMARAVSRNLSSDSEDLVTLLHFCARLIENCSAPRIFSSSERIISLLRHCDASVVLAALDLIFAVSLRVSVLASYDSNLRHLILHFASMTVDGSLSLKSLCEHQERDLVIEHNSRRFLCIRDSNTSMATSVTTAPHSRIYAYICMRALQIAMVLPSTRGNLGPLASVLPLVCRQVMQLVENESTLGFDVSLRALQSLVQLGYNSEMRLCIFSTHALSVDGVLILALQQTSAQLKQSELQDSPAASSHVVERFITLLKILQTLLNEPFDSGSSLVDPRAVSINHVMSALQNANVLHTLVSLLDASEALPPQVLCTLASMLRAFLVRLHNARSPSIEVDLSSPVIAHVERYLKHGVERSFVFDVVGSVTIASPAHRDEFLGGIEALLCVVNENHRRSLSVQFNIGNKRFATFAENVWAEAVRSPLMASGIALFVAMCSVASRIFTHRQRSVAALFNFGLVNSFVCRLPQVLSLLWRTETRYMSEPLKVLLETVSKFALHTGSQALLLQHHPVRLLLHMFQQAPYPQLMSRTCVEVIGLSIKTWIGAYTEFDKAAVRSIIQYLKHLREGPLSLPPPERDDALGDFQLACNSFLACFRIILRRSALRFARYGGIALLCELTEVPHVLGIGPGQLPSEPGLPQTAVMIADILARLAQHETDSDAHEVLHQHTQKLIDRLSPSLAYASYSSTTCDAFTQDLASLTSLRILVLALVAFVEQDVNFQLRSVLLTSTCQKLAGLIGPLMWLASQLQSSADVRKSLSDDGNDPLAPAIGGLHAFFDIVMGGLLRGVAERVQMSPGASSTPASIVTSFATVLLKWTPLPVSIFYVGNAGDGGNDVEMWSVFLSYTCLALRHSHKLLQCSLSSTTPRSRDKIGRYSGGRRRRSRKQDEEQLHRALFLRFFEGDGFTHVMKVWRWALAARLFLHRQEAGSGKDDEEFRVSSPWKTRQQQALPFVLLKSKSRRTRSIRDAPSALSSWLWPPPIVTASASASLLAKRLDELLVELGSMLRSLSLLSASVADGLIPQLISMAFRPLLTAAFTGDSDSFTVPVPLVASILAVEVVVERLLKKPSPSSSSSVAASTSGDDRSALFLALARLGYPPQQIEMALSRREFGSLSDATVWMFTNQSSLSLDQKLLRTLKTCFSDELAATNTTRTRVGLDTARAVLRSLARRLVQPKAGLRNMAKSAAEFLSFVLFESAQSASSSSESQLGFVEEGEGARELVHTLVQLLARAMKTTDKRRLYLFVNIVLKFATNRPRALQLLCREQALVPAIVEYLEHVKTDSVGCTKTVLLLCRLVATSFTTTTSFPKRSMPLPARIALGSACLHLLVRLHCSPTLVPHCLSALEMLCACPAVASSLSSHDTIETLLSCGKPALSTTANVAAVERCVLSLLRLLLEGADGLRDHMRQFLLRQRKLPPAPSVLDALLPQALRDPKLLFGVIDELYVVKDGAMELRVPSPVFVFEKKPESLQRVHRIVSPLLAKLVSATHSNSAFSAAFDNLLDPFTLLRLIHRLVGTEPSVLPMCCQPIKEGDNVGLSFVDVLSHFLVGVRTSSCTSSTNAMATASARARSVRRLSQRLLVKICSVSPDCSETVVSSLQSAISSYRDDCGAARCAGALRILLKDGPLGRHHAELMCKLDVVEALVRALLRIDLNARQGSECVNAVLRAIDALVAFDVVQALPRREVELVLPPFVEKAIAAIGGEVLESSAAAAAVVVDDIDEGPDVTMGEAADDLPEDNHQDEDDEDDEDEDDEEEEEMEEDDEDAVEGIMNEAERAGADDDDDDEDDEDEEEEDNGEVGGGEEEHSANASIDVFIEDSNEFMEPRVDDNDDDDDASSETGDESLLDLLQDRRHRRRRGGEVLPRRLLTSRSGLPISIRESLRRSLQSAGASEALIEHTSDSIRLVLRNLESRGSLSALLARGTTSTSSGVDVRLPSRRDFRRYSRPPMPSDTTNSVPWCVDLDPDDIVLIRNSIVEGLERRTASQLAATPSGCVQDAETEALPDLDNDDDDDDDEEERGEEDNVRQRGHGQLQGDERTAFLAALPPELQAEVLLRDTQEQAATTTTSLSTAMDNASFIATLPRDVREEFLLSQDDAFLCTLPSPLLAEAVLLRQRLRHSNLDGRSDDDNDDDNENDDDVDNADNDFLESQAPSPSSVIARCATRTDASLLPLYSIHALLKLLGSCGKNDWPLLVRFFDSLCAFGNTRSVSLLALLAVLARAAGLRISVADEAMAMHVHVVERSIDVNSAIRIACSCVMLLRRAFGVVRDDVLRLLWRVDNTVGDSNKATIHLGTLFSVASVSAVLAAGPKFGGQLLQLLADVFAVFNNGEVPTPIRLNNDELRLPVLTPTQLGGLFTLLDADLRSTSMRKAALRLVHVVSKLDANRLALFNGLCDSVDRLRISLPSLQRDFCTPWQLASRQARLLSALLLLEAAFMAARSDKRSMESRTRLHRTLSGLEMLWHKLQAALNASEAEGATEKVFQFQPLVEAFFLVRRLQLHEGTAVDTAPSLQDFCVTNRRALNVLVSQHPTLLNSALQELLQPTLNVLDFDMKRRYFRAHLEDRFGAMQRRFRSVRTLVRRDSIFEDSYHQLRSQTLRELRSNMSVQFRGEEGMDAGGLTREWFLVLSREIFNPNYALFRSADDNTAVFQPNKLSYWNPDHLDYFRFVGRFVGKAIYSGALLDAYFTRSFYKHMLGIAPSFADLESIDTDYYKSLKWILENSIDNVLDLTFSAEVDEFGQHRVVDLKESGRHLPVSDATKEEYVRLVTEFRTTEEIRPQIDAFLLGFHELIPKSLISVFNEHELELLICGLPEIDLDDLRAHTEYHGYSETSDVVQWFWRALDAFDQEQRALLIQFVTGTSKVPIGGFKVLQGMSGIQHFQIHRADGCDRLPTTHTCFNQIDLPAYSSPEMLAEKLLIAIREGNQGFAFA